MVSFLKTRISYEKHSWLVFATKMPITVSFYEIYKADFSVLLKKLTKWEPWKWKFTSFITSFIIKKMIKFNVIKNWVDEGNDWITFI